MCNVRPPEPIEGSPNCSGCMADLSNPESYLCKGLHDECPEVRVVFVKTRKVGYLIGHHGRTIGGFESSSGAKIDILSPNSTDDETPVRIAGSSKTVSMALKMVLDLFSLTNLSSAHKSMGAEEMIISASDGRRLKGVLEQVEQETGCKVVMNPTGEEQDCNLSVNVVGTAEVNAKAVAMLRAHIIDDIFADTEPLSPEDLKDSLDDMSSSPVHPPRRRSRTESELSSSSSFNDENRNQIFTESVRVDSLKLAYASLQPLCKKYRVSMEILSNRVPDQQVTISGPEKNVNSAKSELMAEGFGQIN